MAEKSKEEKPKSYAGIPEAVFVDDVSAYMSLEDNNGDVDKVLRKLEEQHSKYKLMEYNLLTRKRRLKAQIPDLENSLQMIKLLQKQKEEDAETQTHFLLGEQVYVKARVPPTGQVSLWLGANVMLEYPLEEALELLNKNLENAKAGLHVVDHDLEFLRDQFTTTEVNMARVYNWNVKRRQAAKGTPA